MAFNHQSIIQKATEHKFTTFHIANFVKNHALQPKTEQISAQAAREILLDEKKQQEYFYQPFQRKAPYEFVADLILYFIDEENKLLKQGLLKPHHSFYQKFISISDSKFFIIQQEFYAELMFLSLEKEVHTHWNMANKLTPEQRISYALQEINHNGAPAFNYIYTICSKEEIQQSNFIFKIEEKSDHLVSMNLKTKTMHNILTTWGEFKKKYISLNAYIDKNLQIEPDYTELLKHTDIKKLNYNTLRALKDPVFSAMEVEYKINGDKKMTTLENISKYNSMDTQLSACLNNKSGYGFDYKEYNDFGALLNHFKSDPFLKNIIPEFVKAKSNKANSATNKSIWTYHLLSMNEKLSAPKETVKRHKI